MKTNIPFFFLFGLMSLLSCKKQPQLTEPSATNLSGTIWQLTRIDSAGASSSPSQADTILLRFKDERVISGNSSGLCGNSYFGVYSISTNDSIRIDSLVSTEIVCANSRYWDYLNVLTKAESLQRSDPELSIYCNQGFTLVFKMVH